VVQTKYYVSPQILSHHSLEKDEFSRFFYYPRTVTTMFSTLLLLNVLAYNIVPMLSAEEAAHGGYKSSQKM
jgi:hypothetical protein